MSRKQWDWTVVLLLTERGTLKNAGIWFHMWSFWDFLNNRVVDLEHERQVKVGAAGKVLAMIQRWKIV